MPFAVAPVGIERHRVVLNGLLIGGLPTNQNENISRRERERKKKKTENGTEYVYVDFGLVVLQDHSDFHLRERRELDGCAAEKLHRDRIVIELLPFGDHHWERLLDYRESGEPVKLVDCWDR